MYDKLASSNMVRGKPTEEEIEEQKNNKK